MTSVTSLPASTPTGSKALRVLVADDFATARALVQRSLARHHLVADEACDGAEAIRLLSGSRYDLLLLDLSMPDVDGLEVLRWLSVHVPCQDAPRVVVISSAAFDEEAALAPFDIYRLMPKPLRRADLAQLVADLTPDAHASR